MPTLFGQVIIPHKDLLAQDAVVNTFNFTGVDDIEDMSTAIYTRLKSFYQDTTSTSSRAVNQYMSNELNFPGARLKLYDASDPEPRVPVFDESMGLTQGNIYGGWPLPGEVAICSSYRAAAESGTNPRRRRGRIFIGPLNANASTQSPNIAARPSSDAISTIAEASLRLAEASTLGAAWVVWSRKNDSGSIIHSGYVDNAFDTQRRRGVEANSRGNWEVETDP